MRHPWSRRRWSCAPGLPPLPPCPSPCRRKRTRRCQAGPELPEQPSAPGGTRRGSQRAWRAAGAERRRRKRPCAAAGGNGDDPGCGLIRSCPDGCWLRQIPQDLDRISSQTGLCERRTGNVATVGRHAERRPPVAPVLTDGTVWPRPTSASLLHSSPHSEREPCVGGKQRTGRKPPMLARVVVRPDSTPRHGRRRERRRRVSP